MLSAYEARNKTQKRILNNKNLQELTMVESYIEKVIQIGCFKVSADGCLEEETIKELENLGYEVTIGRNIRPNFLISWK